MYYLKYSVYYIRSLTLTLMTCTSHCNITWINMRIPVKAEIAKPLEP